MISPNTIEKNLKSIIQENFPRYLTFREQYLTPLRGLPSDPNWRIDTDPLLEQIGVTSYGILKSINFIQHRKGHINISDFDQSFKNIYFHFGLIFDCVESLCRIIVLIEQKLGLIDLNSKLKLSKDKLQADFSDWVDNDYGKKFSDMINNGKPIFYYPQHDNTYLSLIIQNPLKKKYNKYAKTIKDYRNFFIHNPGVDIFKETSTGWLFTIKKEHVDKSKNWANMQFMFDIDRSIFEDPHKMINSDLIVLLQLLNEVWEKIDNRLKSIYDHPNFKELFTNYNRELDF